MLCLECCPFHFFCLVDQPPDFVSSIFFFFFITLCVYFALGALVYDSRCFHRSLANTTAESPLDETGSDRPVRLCGQSMFISTALHSFLDGCLQFVIMRYDLMDCPPPGHGIVSTLVFRALGNILFRYASMQSE